MFVQPAAHFLSMPSLIFGNQVPVKITSASWNLYDKTFQQCAMNSKRILPVIYFDGGDEVDVNYVLGLTSKLRNHIHACGMRPRPPPNFGRKSDIGVRLGKAKEPAWNEDIITYRGECRQMLEDSWSGMGLTKNEEAQLVPVILVVLKDKNTRLYPEVKRWGDCWVGLPTICITLSNLQSSSAGLCANIWYYLLPIGVEF